MDAGNEPGVGVSHGVFLSHNGRLWAFHGTYSGTMQNVHTRAYVLDETTDRWQHKGTVIEGGWLLAAATTCSHGRRQLDHGRNHRAR
jgi:hypothetical protein